MSSSYFAEPSDSLDPTLFEGSRLREGVRMEILAYLVNYMHSRFYGVEGWLEAWLAGSGVSYQWAAHRDPGDLDCLIGIHYEKFRAANPDFSSFGDSDIAVHVNDGLWADLCPHTADFLGQYELTYYCNVDGTDIRNLHPYAAYDLRHNTWTVDPDPHQHAPVNVTWDRLAASDNQRARQIVARYNQLMASVQNAVNPAHRANSEVYLNMVLQEASDMYEEIHLGRSVDFSRTGDGYEGPGNYRWQAGKNLGTVPALKELHDYLHTLRTDEDAATYGIDMPDTQTLIRRAALWEM